jgi:DNA-directed RNA polymerase specialized sigma24 family protein
MSQRAICRCPLCQLEQRIISTLELEDSAQWFLNLAARITSLNAFERTRDLISYVHTAGHEPDKRRVCNGIYVALVSELSSSENADLLQGLLLRMLIPGLHRELRGITVSFPGLSREDLTQQLISTFLDVMRSRGILRKTSYVAASIIEWTKRNTIRWAIRQYRSGDREETGIIIDDLVESPDSAYFELEIQLRDLLDKSVASELISSEDAKLLIAYEIEGMSGEELGKREGLDPKALSHRVRRAIQRMNRKFQKSYKRKSDLPNEGPQ